MTPSAPEDSIRTVPDALEWAVDEHGEDAFLHYGDRTVSYSELDRKASAIAGGLRAQGVEPGDHVCLFLYNSLEYVFTYFALAKMGAVAIPVDTRFTGDTLAYVLSSSEADTIIFDTDTRESYEAIRNEIPQFTMEYFIDSRTEEHPYRDIHSLFENSRSHTPAVQETDTISLTYVQRHASEEPKGVMLPQFSYVNTGWEAGINLFSFSEKDLLFTTLPLYSIFTFQFGIMGALLTGAEFALSDPFDPDTFWEEVDRYDATVLLYLGRMLSVLYNQRTANGPQSDTVEMAIGHGFGFGTDEVLIQNFEEEFDITVFEGYGVTQSATLATYNRPDDRRIGSSGKPVSYADIAVVDDDDRPVPTGESGEIVIRPTRPNTMMQGYYNNQAKAMAVCRNFWIHTGDIGYIDEGGYLHFVANEDNSIYQGRIAGRISSLEIESVIDALPDVRESAVVGVENGAGEEEIKAVVVPEDGADLDPTDICRQCEEQLPYLKVPRYIDIRDELPRGPSGNVPDKVLQAQSLTDDWDRESGYNLSR